MTSKNPCKHNWINVFGEADWSAQVYFGFRKGEIVFLGNRCTICGEFKKRDRMIAPWDICFKCAGKMTQISKHPDKFVCNNCGDTWPSTK